jgi:hypothetical protein
MRLERAEPPSSLGDGVRGKAFMAPIRLGAS